MVGPALGPILGGIIVTYTSWRVIYWVQAAFGGVAMVLSYFVLHETLHTVRATELKGQSFRRKASTFWQWTKPTGCFKLLGQRNFLFIVCPWFHMLPEASVLLTLL